MMKRYGNGMENNKIQVEMIMSVAELTVKPEALSPEDYNIVAMRGKVFKTKSYVNERE